MNPFRQFRDARPAERARLVKPILYAAALLGALPIVTIISMIWMHAEGKDVDSIAKYSTTTFWLVLPTLPMFLVFPVLVKAGFGFWIALLLSIAVMLVLYGLQVLLLRVAGIAI